MANYSITKRASKNGNSYSVRVRSKEKGVVIFSKSKSFKSKVLAVKWAKSTVNKVESNLDNTTFDLIECTLGQLIERYLEMKQKSGRPIGRSAFFAFRQILNYPIAKILTNRLNAKDIVNFAIDRRDSPSTPSPSTIAVDISCLRKVLKIARPLLGINITDQAVTEAYPALHDLKLISRSDRRERRLQGDEFQLLLTSLKRKESHPHCQIPYHDIFLLSILTCCRISELCNMQWKDLNIDNATIIVRDRKNPNGSIGNNSVLPLLGDALNIVRRQPKLDNRIFPFNSKSITTGFRRTINQLGIKNLRYHDLRREGASRLIEEGYSLEETARITGHNDLNILWKVYISIHPHHFRTKRK
ncbi:site-specific integrase [Aliiglaciecola sp. NS0011-25]|uniref:tyrosine-type recombinase/integrase n=1 Tax=Aliiglaciecola sp. NS0011-25 TaxID=3127654 RepID=UPI0031096A4B